MYKKVISYDKIEQIEIKIGWLMRLFGYGKVCYYIVSSGLDSFYQTGYYPLSVLEQIKTDYEKIALK